MSIAATFLILSIYFFIRKEHYKAKSNVLVERNERWEEVAAPFSLIHVPLTDENEYLHTKCVLQHEDETTVIWTDNELAGAITVEDLWKLSEEARKI